MDGVETIRALRRLHPTVKIIAVSAGWGSPGIAVKGGDYDMLEDARRAGADLTIEKPFELQEFTDTVAQLLRPGE